MAPNIVLVKATLLYARIHCDTFETEVLKTEVLAHDLKMRDWANEKISDCLHDRLIKKFDDDKQEDGFYTVLFVIQLSGGQDGMGDYWSECALVGDYSIVRMDHDEYDPEDLGIAPLDLDELAIMFPNKQEEIHALFGIL